MAKINKSNSVQKDNPAVKTSGSDCISKKAYELWEQKGRVQGKDLDIWLEAEKMVKVCKR